MTTTLHPTTTRKTYIRSRGAGGRVEQSCWLIGRRRILRRRHRRVAALAALPCAEMYERSFMHRDHAHRGDRVRLIVTSRRQLKFWKKMQHGIEFVKHFRAHMAPIAGRRDARRLILATTAADKAFKVFDVLAFDMISWVTLDFTPQRASGLAAATSRARLAVCDADSPEIRLYDATRAARSSRA